MAGQPTVEELIADPGVTIHPGPVITTDDSELNDGNASSPDSERPASADPSTLASKTHLIDSVQYIDANGHLHAVLIDTVTVSTGFKQLVTMEILSDVVMG